MRDSPKIPQAQCVSIVSTPGVFVELYFYYTLRLFQCCGHCYLFIHTLQIYFREAEDVRIWGAVCFPSLCFMCIFKGLKGLVLRYLLCSSVVSARNRRVSQLLLSCVPDAAYHSVLPGVGFFRIVDVLEAGLPLSPRNQACRYSIWVSRTWPLF